MNELELTSPVGDMSPTSWKPNQDMTFNEWADIGNTLQLIQGSLYWWIGDWLNYGELKWGETYTQAIDVTGWRVERLRDAKWVAAAVSPEVRRDDLSWSHHKAIAHLAGDRQAHWLEVAADSNLSVAALREYVKVSAEGKVAIEGNGVERAGVYLMFAWDTHPLGGDLDFIGAFPALGDAIVSSFKYGNCRIVKFDGAGLVLVEEKRNHVRLQEM